MNLNDGGIAYDAWLNADPAYWDDSEEVEAFELHEAFTFGGLRYLLTGDYDGDNLENAALYLVTSFGLIEQSWGETDRLYSDGYQPDRISNDSITDRCYAVADAALKSWEAA